MKRNFQLFISASAASVLAFSALAQDSPNPKAEQPEYTRDRLPEARRAARLNAVKASELIGMTVKNGQNEKVGKVDDLAVDVESGRVVQVILSTGGFIGIGDAQTAVPPGALHHNSAQKFLRLDADKEKLKSAPHFEMSKWAESSESNHLFEVYSYYGEERAFRFIRSEDSIAYADNQNVEDRSQFMIPISRLGRIQKASKLIGTPVHNLQDEKLGKVENILVDLPSGRIVVLVISSGGFLGLGDELSSVPPSSFQYVADRNILQLDASRELLTTAPHFKTDQWPAFDQPSYSDGVYRTYKVQPYFSSKFTTEPDSSELLVRERIDRKSNAPNQGSAKTDIATTAQIRREIDARKDVSLNARNVKIVTKEGRVTLLGPVDTAEEKRLIGDIADRIARSENVENSLEVTIPPINNN